MIIIVLRFAGLGHSAGQPVIEIEGRPVSYGLVHVWNDKGGDPELVADYHDAESDIDFSSRIPIEVQLLQIRKTNDF